MTRIEWIDMLRGFSMMAILWFHTEVYYTDTIITPYAMYVGDVLAVFFFLSGYLMYSDKAFIVRHKLYRILRSLIIPYFFFATIIAFPKSWIHQQQIDIISITKYILLGKASWFIAALIVAQLLFTFSIAIFKHRYVLIILAFITLFLSSYIGNGFNPADYYNSYDAWYINEAMLGYSIMVLGYIYHQHEERVNKINNLTIITTLLLSVIFIKLYILKTDAQLIFGPIIVSNYLLFIGDIILTTLLLVYFFRLLPTVKLIQWTGRHSLVYYFICGAVPLIVSKIFHIIGFYSNSYFVIFLVFVVVYLFATIITWMIYKYLPWIVGV
jgi:fucose 4-O-acetylase-like acetyltransferase